MAHLTPASVVSQAQNTKSTIQDATSEAPKSKGI